MEFDEKLYDVNVPDLITEVDLLVTIVEQLPKLTKDAAHRVVAYPIRLLEDMHGIKANAKE